MLRDLQDDGHEMGCHTLNHISPRDYVDTHTVEEFIVEEIDPALEVMDLEGLEHSSFSYPWGNDTHALNAGLLDRFDILRDSGTIADTDHIFHKWRGQRHINAAAVDDGMAPLEDIEAAMDMAVEDETALMLYAHKIAEESSSVHIDPDALEAILAAAEERGLAFHTLSYLVAE